jgi:hypothetical protein
MIALKLKAELKVPIIRNLHHLLMILNGRI